MWSFDMLVWLVLDHGADILGSEGREEAKRLTERYIRWTRGVDWRVPGYMIIKEAQRDKLRTRARKRAGKFDGKRKERKEEKLA